MHCVTWQGRDYFVYESVPLSDSWTAQDARRQIVDAPLMLNFRMGHGVYHFQF